MSGWIGVDLDGTLAKYDGWKGQNHIGDPIPEMLFRVRKWIADGKTVKIFTARVCQTLNLDGTVDDGSKARQIIQDWCLKHIGTVLDVTNKKDFGMIELWDDRAVAVEMNTGKILGRN